MKTESLPFHSLSFKERLERVHALPEEEQWAQGLLLGDEWANSLTHGLGLALSIVGLIFLLTTPLAQENSQRLLSFGVYGLSLIALYAASTCYHAVRQPNLKKILRTVDHCAIYTLIAGSYTPFTLLILGEIWGWPLFCIVWSLAFIGVSCKIFFRHKYKVLSTSIYLFMGWLVVIAAEPLIRSFHYEGLCWLLAGGFSYTFGVIFYLKDKKRFYHMIWHLFVLGGSICHYLAILFYI